MFTTGHNWHNTYSSVKAAEEDLKGFKYQGDGWYINKTDTLYVTSSPSQKHDGSQRHPNPATNSLHIMCWNMPNGRDMMWEEFKTMMMKPVFVNYK